MMYTNLQAVLLCFCAIVFARTTVAKNGTDLCRCVPGDVCWPSSATWNSFNATVHGRLIATVPQASVCHDPFYDEAACAGLKEGWDLTQTL
jgi:hypothetical protein